MNQQTNKNQQFCTKHKKSKFLTLKNYKIIKER